MAQNVSPFQQYGIALTAGPGANRVFVFRQGDTLSGLASKFYRDWTQWRLIANANNVLDPRQVEPGTVLMIPPLPLQMGTGDVFTNPG
ncbi:MAG TPA: LysM peptidoglycan-binding domain-containing protein [Blastocatellia bacterium]